MAAVVVGFWNCTKFADWFDLTMERRIVKMLSASSVVAAEGLARSTDRHEPLQSIFVAPEYAFSNPELANAAKPAVQTDTNGYWLLKQALVKHTGRHPSMLMAPGTIAHVNSHYKAMNTCMVAYQRNIITFDKKAGVGEVCEGDGLEFKPGSGVGRMTIQRPGAENTIFGFQICKDATEVSAVPPPDTDVWIVVGQGVGKAAVLRDAKKLLIVADIGNFGVYEGRIRNELASYRKDTILGCDIHFYLARL